MLLVFWLSLLILSFLIFRLLKTQSSCAPHPCDIYQNSLPGRTHETSLFYLTGYSPVGQYKPNNLRFHSPWQCFSLLKTEASRAIRSGHVIFVSPIKCLPTVGAMSGSKLIAISHSSLDTDRGYRKGAMETVFGNTSLPKRHPEKLWGQKKDIC